MGHLLQPGDVVLGYDLSRAIVDDDVLGKLNFQHPDVVLVKKVYPEKSKKSSKKQKRRNRRGKAKQEKSLPSGAQSEVEELQSSASSVTEKDSIDDALLPTVPQATMVPIKKIVKSSTFGWTGGDDEEYQEFHRRLALDEHEEDEDDVEESQSQIMAHTDTASDGESMPLSEDENVLILGK